MSDAALLNRTLAIEVARVTEAAALAAYKLAGRGDEKAADQAAVDAMRKAFDKLEIDGMVVIGEGERDEAPMLFIGEKVGTGRGPKVDIALDPLEGTTLTAKSMPGAMAVVALAVGGTLLHAPDVYMDKIAVGGGYPIGVVDLDAEPGDNIASLAKAKGVRPDQITACVLDRPRHEKIIASIRKTGAAVRLITDGDVAGVIDTAEAHTGVDIYIGQGGAPEGVLAAAALRCIGGQILGRLVFKTDDERMRAEKIGLKDLNRIYRADEMASGDVIFASTGVTTGSMLTGVVDTAHHLTTETIVMRSATGTVRWIKTRHPKHL
ncbi:Fructose-1,6-bisphosphatase class 2 [Alphaproteobacteria bacterium SO-S41]|nr:Fructose-1,6-bisphosphatase class 2 [Alphaproteobacteria bacterium SO-S41]